MSEYPKNIRRSNSIAEIEETYRDHPCMIRLNALKAQLKQEKLQDKTFYQSVKLNKSVCQ